MLAEAASDVENVNDYPVIPPFPFPFPGIHGVPFMSFHEHHSKIHHCFVLIILIQGFTCTTNTKHCIQSNYLFLEAAFETKTQSPFFYSSPLKNPHYSEPGLFQQLERNSYFRKLEIFLDGHTNYISKNWKFIHISTYWTFSKMARKIIFQKIGLSYFGKLDIF